MKNILFALILFFIAIEPAQSFAKFSLLQPELWEKRLPVYLEESSQLKHPQEKKPWTVMIYMAADNDLRGFVPNNIKQMVKAGSNCNINIVIHLDMRIAGNKKITRRYYIENDKIVLMNGTDAKSQKMDSGASETLISFCTWAIAEFPADDYGLIFWNHGSGIIDPGIGRLVNPSNFFRFNPDTNKWEFDRDAGFLDYLDSVDSERGICWDDSTGNYLTNQTMHNALATICTQSLGGKKFSIIGFDACLMAMIEIANIIKHHAHYLVASEEVERGAGWNYHYVFEPFITHSLTPPEFAEHIVAAYGKEYGKRTDDYTLSAIDLGRLDLMEENIHAVANHLNNLIATPTTAAIKSHAHIKGAIKASRNSQNCACFGPHFSYVDLHNFYTNLQLNIKQCTFKDQAACQPLIEALNNELEKGKQIIETIVFANTVGTNLAGARGLSIYFPENKIHSSYSKTLFAATKSWMQLIAQNARA